MTINTNEIAPSLMSDTADPVLAPELTYGRGYPMTDVGRRSLGELAYAASQTSQVPRDFMTELQMPHRQNQALQRGRASTRIQTH